MTTIAYRNGIMAADTRAWAGSKAPIGTKIKIRRLPDGSLAGVTSSQPGAGEVILDQLEAWGGQAAEINQCPPPDQPIEDYTVLVVGPDGFGYLADDRWTFTGPLEADFFAIGSGRDFAWTAMELGARPEVAVSIACKGDPLSAPPITILGHV